MTSAEFEEANRDLNKHFAELIRFAYRYGSKFQVDGLKNQRRSMTRDLERHYQKARQQASQNASRLTNKTNI